MLYLFEPLNPMWSRTEKNHSLNLWNLNEIALYKTIELPTICRGKHYISTQHFRTIRLGFYEPNTQGHCLPPEAVGTSPLQRRRQGLIKSLGFILISFGLNRREKISNTLYQIDTEYQKNIRPKIKLFTPSTIFSVDPRLSITAHARSLYAK